METQQAQIKINLSLELKRLIQTRANKYGMPLAGYIKHLILKEVEEEQYPVFQASEATEKAYAKAMKDYKEGRAVTVTDIDKFFDEL